MFEKVVLTIELNQKFTVGSSPNSDGSVLSSREDVVGIDVEWSDCSPVSVGNLPDNLLGSPVEGSDETVSPAGHDGVIIQSNAAAGSAVLFACGACEHGTVLR